MSINHRECVLVCIVARVCVCGAFYIESLCCLCFLSPTVYPLCILLRSKGDNHNCMTSFGHYPITNSCVCACMRGWGRQCWSYGMGQCARILVLFCGAIVSVIYFIIVNSVEVLPVMPTSFLGLFSLSLSLPLIIV